MMPEQMLEEVFEMVAAPRGLGSRAPASCSGLAEHRVFRRDAPAATGRGRDALPRPVLQPFRKQSFQKRLRREIFPVLLKIRGACERHR